MPFEPQFPAQWAHLFHGHISTQVADPNGIPAETIISMEDEWFLKVSWQVHGMLVPSLGGKWQVRAYLESIGPGPEVLIAQKDVPMTGASSYEETFRIQGLPVDPNEPPRSGPYKLVTVVTSLNLLDKPSPFAGYEEGGILQFYEGRSLPGRML